MKQIPSTSDSISAAPDLLSAKESMMIPKKMFIRITLMSMKKVKSNPYLKPQYSSEMYLYQRASPTPPPLLIPKLAVDNKQFVRDEQSIEYVPPGETGA